MTKPTGDEQPEGKPAETRKQAAGHIILLKPDKTELPRQAADRARDVSHRHGLAPVHIYEHVFKGFSVDTHLPDHVIQRLIDDEEVEEVVEDLDVKLGAVSYAWQTSAVRSSPFSDVVDSGPGYTDVHVFVVDSGISAGVGNLDIVEWRTFMPGTTNVYDDVNHGTGVACCIGGRNIDTAGNKLIMGPAPGVKIHSFKIADATGQSSGVFGALDAVVAFKLANPACPCIANCSFSLPTTMGIYNTIMSNILNTGVVVVACTGNDGADASGYWPARAPGVIAVAAYDSTFSFASFSNNGPRVDCLAPGAGVQTLSNNNVLEYASGTSFAAPVVTGVCAHVLARNPTWGWQQLKDHLYKTQRSLMGTPLGRPDITGCPNGTTQLSIIVPAAGTVYRDEFLMSDGSGLFGHTVFSPNRLYKLTMQGDANLILYRVSDNHGMWATSYTDVNGQNPTVAPGPGPYKFVTQWPDGHVVMYNATGNPIWANGVYPGPVGMRVTDTGKLEVFDGSNGVMFSR